MQDGASSDPEGTEREFEAFARLETMHPEVRDPAAYLRRSVVNGVVALHRRREVERRHQPPPSPSSFNPEVDQIAELLDCPSGTAKSLIYRGLRSVRRRMRP